MTIDRGTVAEFDDQKGVGVVELRDGRRLFFHCTSVADASRAIAVGSDLVCEVVAGHGGGWEATSLVATG